VSKKAKGITAVADLMIFAVVLVLTITVVYFLSLAPIIDNIVKIRTEAQIQIRDVENGGGIVSFLSSNTIGIPYSEGLALLAAKDHSSGIDSDIGKAVADLKGGLVLSMDGKAIKNYGTVGDYSSKADIALPGLKKGEVKTG